MAEGPNLKVHFTRRALALGRGGLRAGLDVALDGSIVVLYPPRCRREGAAPLAPLNSITPISVAEPSPSAKFTSKAGRGPPGRPAGRLAGTPTEHVEPEQRQTRDGVRRACCEQAAR